MANQSAFEDPNSYFNKASTPLLVVMAVACPPLAGVYLGFKAIKAYRAIKHKS